jgi:hypothetical protein
MLIDLSISSSMGSFLGAPDHASAQRNSPVILLQRWFLRCRGPCDPLKAPKPKTLRRANSHWRYQRCWVVAVYRKPDALINEAESDGGLNITPRMTGKGSKSPVWWIVGIVAVLCSARLFVGTDREQCRTPEIQISERSGNIEIRDYAPMLVYRKPHRGSQLVPRLDYFQHQQKGPIARAEFIDKALKLATERPANWGGLLDPRNGSPPFLSGRSRSVGNEPRLFVAGPFSCPHRRCCFSPALDGSTFAFGLCSELFAEIVADGDPDVLPFPMSAVRAVLRCAFS